MGLNPINYPRHGLLIGLGNWFFTPVNEGSSPFYVTFGRLLYKVVLLRTKIFLSTFFEKNDKKAQNLYRPYLLDRTRKLDSQSSNVSSNLTRVTKEVVGTTSINTHHTCLAQWKSNSFTQSRLKVRVFQRVHEYSQVGRHQAYTLATDRFDSYYSYGFVRWTIKGVLSPDWGFESLRGHQSL